MTPRGRIFYNPDNEEFTIAVGSWIEQYPQAVALIEDEFNLKTPNILLRLRAIGILDSCGISQKRDTKAGMAVASMETILLILLILSKKTIRVR